MLRGKALNILPSYDKNAEDALAKAVKLDPTLVDGWTNLGEVYWKHADVESAKNCFTASLNHVGENASPYPQPPNWCTEAVIDHILKLWKSSY